MLSQTCLEWMHSQVSSEDKGILSQLLDGILHFWPEQDITECEFALTGYDAEGFLACYSGENPVEPCIVVSAGNHWGAHRIKDNEFFWLWLYPETWFSVEEFLNN